MGSVIPVYLLSMLLVSFCMNVLGHEQYHHHGPVAPPTLAPTHHHHHHHHHHHAPTHHHKGYPPSHPPIKPPSHPPVKPPSHPPVKPPSHPPVKPPSHPPVKPPSHPPVKPPSHPPVKPPSHPPVKPPSHPPVKPPSHPPVKPPSHPPVKPPSHPPVKPPSHPPVKQPSQPPKKAPTPHYLRKLVAVQGVVYCKPCKNIGANTLFGAKPLSGAIVKLQCNNTRHPQEVKTATDKNGYFIVHAPKSVTNFGAHKCKVSLVWSPLNTCDNPTDFRGGLSGARLIPEKSSWKLPFALYSVGPLAYEPSKTKCY